jgi:hypothetical protein
MPDRNTQPIVAGTFGREGTRQASLLVLHNNQEKASHQGASRINDKLSNLDCQKFYQDFDSLNARATAGQTVAQSEPERDRQLKSTSERLR